MWGGVQAGQGQAQTRGREESPASDTHCAGISCTFTYSRLPPSPACRYWHLHFTDKKTEAQRGCGQAGNRRTWTEPIPAGLTVHSSPMPPGPLPCLITAAMLGWGGVEVFS